jgi:hypothetical protein
LGPLDFDHPGRYAIHDDSVVTQFHGRHARKHPDATLAARVIEKVGERRLVGSRADIDDPAPMFGRHVPTRSLGT